VNKDYQDTLPISQHSPLLGSHVIFWRKSVVNKFILRQKFASTIMYD